MRTGGLQRVGPINNGDPARETARQQLLKRIANTQVQQLTLGLGQGLGHPHGIFRILPTISVGRLQNLTRPTREKD